MKNKKGFTLIELLAVIVILGLLLAIAIPSITRYINQSRKKTVVSSIDGYISSVINDVNDQTYNFTEANIIYALPIECIGGERGGNSSFGEWSPVSDDYWAYILVQYNPEDFSYTYGFTFKDSSGYGMYPTTIDKLEKDGKQIQINLNFNFPKTGFITNITEKENWQGFIINDETKLRVLNYSEDGICQIVKPCIVSNGTGTNVGDEIKCGEELFYIIENNESMLTMFTKYGISTTSHTQNKNVELLSFSNVAYWLEDGKIKDEYKIKNPAYVYDVNSNIYNHLTIYEGNLINDFGILSARTNLVNMEQLGNLGCITSPWHSTTCKNAPAWVLSNVNYWTGSIEATNALWYVDPGGYLHGRHYSYSGRIRPVVTISKDEINFN